jgi:hypothetical protein
VQSGALVGRGKGDVGVLVGRGKGDDISLGSFGSTTTLGSTKSNVLFETPKPRGRRSYSQESLSDWGFAPNQKFDPKNISLENVNNFRTEQMRLRMLRNENVALPSRAAGHMPEDNKNKEALVSALTNPRYQPGVTTVSKNPYATELNLLQRGGIRKRSASEAGTISTTVSPASSRTGSTAVSPASSRTSLDVTRQTPAHESYIANLQKQDKASRNTLGTNRPVLDEGNVVRQRTNAPSSRQQAASSEHSSSFENISLDSLGSGGRRLQGETDALLGRGLLQGDLRARGFPHNMFDKPWMTKDAINKKIQEMLTSKPVKIGGAVIGGGAALVGAGVIGNEIGNSRSALKTSEVQRELANKRIAELEKELAKKRDDVIAPPPQQPAVTTPAVLPPPIPVTETPRVTPKKRKNEDSIWKYATVVPNEDEIQRNNVIDDYWMHLKRSPYGVGNRFASSYDF